MGSVFRFLVLLTFVSFIPSFSSEAFASRVSESGAAIWMRDLSASVTELCAGAKQTCFQLHFVVEPFGSTRAALEAIKKGVSKENALRLRFAELPAARVPETVRSFLQIAQVSSHPNSRGAERALLERIRFHSRARELQTIEAVGFDSIVQQRYLIFLLKNSRFDLGEALVLGVGDQEAR